MNRLGLYEVAPKAKYKTYYKRDFKTSRCNEKWTTDVSEFHIASGKLYLSPILDIHNREIISYSILKSPNYEQTKEMLSGAFEKYDI